MRICSRLARHQRNTAFGHTAYRSRQSSCLQSRHTPNKTVQRSRRVRLCFHSWRFMRRLANLCVRYLRFWHKMIAGASARCIRNEKSVGGAEIPFSVPCGFISHIVTTEFAISAPNNLIAANRDGANRRSTGHVLSGFGSHWRRFSCRSAWSLGAYLLGMPERRWHVTGLLSDERAANWHPVIGCSHLRSRLFSIFSRDDI